MTSKTIRFVLYIAISLAISQVETFAQIEEVVPSKMQKINGLSFVASSRPFDFGEIEILKQTHAKDLAIMPFAFLPSLSSTEILFDHPTQWWGERSEGCRETINLCQKEGFEIMLKPQLWVGSGDFTGHIEMKTEEDWLNFEISYTKYIMHFAKIAEEYKVKVYCIGTELGRFVKERPQFWKKLVQETREIYSGKLTYAENWDCFDAPEFLNDLDYIGVDAYFPIAEGKEPTLDEIRLGWKPHIEKLKSTSERCAKPILFTECGYRSIDYAAANPWDYDKKDHEVNEVLQARLLSALFELWNEDWMSGGYIWKWFPYHTRAGGPQNDQFTPQNKLAERTITDFFKPKP